MLTIVPFGIMAVSSLKLHQVHQSTPQVLIYAIATFFSMRKSYIGQDNPPQMYPLCDLENVEQVTPKGCSRNYPQWGSGPHFFFRPLHPQDTHGVRAPWPPGHVSALINPASVWIKYTLTPRTSYPHPSDTLSMKHPPSAGQKSACGPPPWG